MITSGYLSPALEVRIAPEKGGYAVYALRPVKKDELLALWSGKVATLQDVLELPADERGHTIQVFDGLYLAPMNMEEPADRINHSCSPNAGICGQIALVAMREIPAGEEITFDYAMADSTDYDAFDCACGSPLCRGRVSGQDWQLPELWDRYDGYFSSYLQRRIDQARRRMTGGAGG